MPNAIANFTAGQQARQQYDTRKKQNRLAELSQQYGGDWVQGKTNGLAELAQASPDAAFALQDRFASQGAASAKAASDQRKQQLESAGMVAGAIYNAETPEQFDHAKSVLTGLGAIGEEDAAKYTFEGREALIGMVRGLEGNIADDRDQRDFSAGMQKWMADYGLKARSQDRADNAQQFNQATNERDFGYQQQRDNVSDQRNDRKDAQAAEQFMATHGLDVQNSQHRRVMAELGYRLDENKFDYEQSEDVLDRREAARKFEADQEYRGSTLDIQRQNAETSRISATRPPAGTSAMRNAEAAGLRPGTQEYRDFLTNAGKTSISVKNEKPFTETQSKLALFSNMMDVTAPVIKRLQDQLTTSDYWRGAAGDSNIANALIKTPEFRQYQSAGRQWAEGLLRIQTGAAATEPEIERVFNTYFPQPGDDEQTMLFKEQQRVTAQNSIKLAMQGRIGDPVPEDFSSFGRPDPSGEVPDDVRSLGSGSLSRASVGSGSPQQGGDPIERARAAIANGAPREAVIQRMRENGIDPAGL